MKNIIAEDVEYIKQSTLDWKRLYGKTVLVVGANGLLPSYMVETLLSLNDTHLNNSLTVIGAVRNHNKANERFKQYLNRKDFKIVELDLISPISFDEKINFVIHAASQASPKYFGVDPVGTMLPNCIGTYNLLKMAQDNPIEGFLFFSSGEIYGEVNPINLPISEHFNGIIDSTNIRSCYAESKRIGETMCVSWYHQFGIPTYIVRPFHTYGPGLQFDDGRVFADFVSNIVHDHNIILKSDGSALRCFCYIADAVVGFFTVLFNGQKGEAYNIGNPYQEISIKDLAYCLIKLFPEKKLRVIETPAATGISYLKSNINRNCPNISKIQNIGWTPHFSIEEGFRRTIMNYL